MTQPTRGFGVVVKRPFSASASAWRIIASSKAVMRSPCIGFILLFARSFDFLHRFAEIIRSFEAAVDRGEPDVGDLVELRQFTDDEVADPAGGHLAFAEGAQPLDDPIHRALHFGGCYRALA